MSARCLKIRFVFMALIQVNEFEEAPTKIEAGATTVNASIGKVPEERQPVFCGRTAPRAATEGRPTVVAHLTPSMNWHDGLQL